MKHRPARRAASQPAAPHGLSTGERMAHAARVDAAVVDAGAALDDALVAVASSISAADRRVVQAIAFGAVRWHFRIERWIASLLARPAQAPQPLIRALLRVALHQLGWSSHPPHAVVNESVEAARLLRHPRAASFVNAVLRRFTRERDAISAQADADPEARYAHPKWLIERIRADWPQEAEGIFAANNEPAPMWLRVNRRRLTRAAYLDALMAQGIGATAADSCPDAVRLATPMDVDQLPGFAVGDVSVQDAAAQLAAPLLDAHSGMRVLDACAAPGGKTAHILERTPDVGELLALDRAPERLVQVEANLRRLGLEARVVTGDAARPSDWWDGTPFERILLDVSCSATGVIRRHPDIKLLRRAADVEALRQDQYSLLEALWPLLARRGRLLYATCSVLRAENQRVIVAFLAARGDAFEASVPPDLQMPGMRTPGEPGVQILPGAAGMDGFYYACLERH